MSCEHVFLLRLLIIVRLFVRFDKDLPVAYSIVAKAN